ncbi:tRNA (N(6)-L-threonylcarbamoyladenosine(37)-C(2))-methylthiotransferase MtaB [Thermosulfuriphilus sp.]
MKVALVTLGCKVNQVESASLLEAFEAQGASIVPFGEKADLYVVNTCAVTAKAAYQSRQLIRRAQRQSPQARVIATGCYVQVAPFEIVERSLGSICLIGNDQKARLVELALNGDDCLEIYVGDIRRVKKIAPFFVRRLRGRTRAFLRVQDGCSAFCSYCIVPYSRGPSRSLPLEEVKGQVKAFVEEGYREIVVTGIHLGHYGKDLTPPLNLVTLLSEIESLGPERIRLSSLEVGEVDDGFLRWAQSSERLCPHFHIPLQSGADEILEAMNRHYRAREYLERLNLLRALFPQAALGADVMVGFPGETEEAFSQTYRLIEESPLTYLHVFPFSPRPGTLAEALPGRISPVVVAQRLKLLRALSQRKRKSFYQGQLGRVLSVLVEGIDRATGLLKGTSENYLPVLLDGEASVGEIVPVRIERIIDDKVFGIPL